MSDRVATASLAETLEGELLLAGVDGFDRARTVWNAMIDRQPAVVARPASAADDPDNVFHLNHNVRPA